MNNGQLKRASLKPFFYSYLITDPTEYGATPITFKQNLTKVLKTHQVDMICFRDKSTKNIEPLAKICLDVARQFGIKKVLINGNITLATTLHFDGVHLTSTQFSEIKEAKKQNLFTFISCHSEDEVKFAKKNSADGVTFSPIFFKENKGEPKGCEILANIVEKYQNNAFAIIALGGITDKEKVQKVKETRCNGFASITYFTNNL